MWSKFEHKKTPYDVCHRRKLHRPQELRTTNPLKNQIHFLGTAVGVPELFLEADGKTSIQIPMPGKMRKGKGTLQLGVVTSLADTNDTSDVVIDVTPRRRIEKDHTALTKLGEEWQLVVSSLRALQCSQQNVTHGLLVLRRYKIFNQITA